jgi:hypothetical protein
MTTATKSLSEMTRDELLAQQLRLRQQIAESGPMADERGELIRRREEVSVELQWRR